MLENARIIAGTIVVETIPICNKTTITVSSNMIGMDYRTSFYLRDVISPPVHKGLKTNIYKT